jgi:glyoxylase-like metal-dependent hydrolase (beta-lactamase superfamily II)
MSDPSSPSTVHRFGDLVTELSSVLPEALTAAGEDAKEPQAIMQVPWLLRFPLRSPTLLPAMHTNAYVVGDRDLLVIDPGTPDEQELNRLLALLAVLRGQGRQVRGLLLTHHHYDHASGVPFLQAALGVPVLAHAATAERIAVSLGVRVDQLIAEGDLLPIGPAGLRALHTPGHAPGHLCFHDEAGGELIAGDMIASVGTILIHPDDDGDMRLYLQSLHRLLAKNSRRLWPAHGAAVTDTAGLLHFYIGHRQKREDKVVAALRDSAGTLRQLVATVYSDTPVGLHGLAMGSLLAHLRKLQDEQRVTLDEHGVWQLVS